MAELLIDQFNYDFTFNLDKVKQIELLSTIPQLSHLIISGSSGVGKKSLAKYFIMCKNNVPVLNIKNVIYEIKHGTKKLEVYTKHSDYHLQLNLSTYGVYDKTIIKELLIPIIKTKPIKLDYHTIIIENAESLSVSAQQALRRILEIYVNNCRFIFIVNISVPIILANISRSIQIKLSAPTNLEIKNIIQNYISNEDHINYIISICDRNIKKALNLAQILMYDETYKCEETSHLDKIVHMIKHFKHIKEIPNIRDLVYDLLIQCVDPYYIISYIFLKIGTIDKINILLKFENEIKHGNKPIFSIEAFIINMIN